MCGIFGIALSSQSSVTPTKLFSGLEALFRLSEARGKEAAGFALRWAGRTVVHKRAERATQMTASPDYQAVLEELFPPAVHDAPIKGPLVVIGHARLVTNGFQLVPHNNQPVVKDGLIGIHNGIIVNDADLWQRHPHLRRTYDVDTEVLLALLNDQLDKSGDIIEAVGTAFDQIEGTASCVLMGNSFEEIILATNHGSLYTGFNQPAGEMIFASEHEFLLDYNKTKDVPGQIPEIKQLSPMAGLILNPTTLAAKSFSCKRQSDEKRPPTIISAYNLEDSFERDAEKRKNLRRCTRCILPETMPFIDFDSNGVCSYCRNYKPMQVNGRNALEKSIAPFRGDGDKPDCVFMFSGGRDSSYGLHYAKKELGLNPLAYTYDWGVLTNLGRRNQARMCGQLQVEHILRSADIQAKRKYVRKNIEAWLNRPRLGTVPLFMAGDKQYLYYVNQIKKANNVDLVIVCENPLERAKFKAGFCGIREGDGRAYDIGTFHKLQLFWYYTKEMLLQPGYVNSSLFDSLFAFWSSYFISHDYLYLFDYIPWDEEQINNTLIGDYNWETDPETESTWRIGDGTTAFYNYIYNTVAGFSENDVLRSNQIREGILTRQEALELIAKENLPRWQSLHWYAETIGFNLTDALRTINNMKRLYS